MLLQKAPESAGQPSVSLVLSLKAAQKCICDYKVDGSHFQFLGQYSEEVEEVQK